MMIKLRTFVQRFTFVLFLSIAPMFFVLNSNASDARIEPLVFNKTYFVEEQPIDEEIYYKFTVKKQGLLIVSGRIYGLGGQNWLATVLYGPDNLTTLYSDTSGSSLFRREAYAALMPGTYFIKNTSSKKKDFSVRFIPYPEKSGSRKANARKLKRGKPVTGVIGINDNKKDFYKIVLKKPSKVTLIINTYTETGSGLNINVSTKKSGRVTVGMYRMLLLGKEKIALNRYLEGKKKLPAGTYYLAVSKPDYSKGGAYRIRWR